MIIENGQPKRRFSIKGKIVGNTVGRKDNEKQGKKKRILIGPPVIKSQYGR